MTDGLLAAIVGAGGAAVLALIAAVRSRRGEAASATVQETTATLNALEIAERATRIANEADLRSKSLEAEHRALDRRVAELAVALAECEQERGQISGLRARVRDLELRNLAPRRNGTP